MSQHLIVSFTSANPGQAEIIKSALVAAGIPAATSRAGAGAAYGLTVGPLGRVDILVPAAYAAQAAELLSAIRRGDLDDDDDTIVETDDQ